MCTTTRQLPFKILPGTCAVNPIVRPDTSTPSISPFSKWCANAVSQVPLSGSMPTQQGHNTSQLQTSRRLPSSLYAINPPFIGNFVSLKIRTLRDVQGRAEQSDLS